MNTQEILKVLRKLPGDFGEEIANLKASLSADNDRLFRITNAGPMNPGRALFSTR